MSGGTEAFPNLGLHCSEESCHQLDFLPFRCDSCDKVFCLDHRTYKAHECPKAGLKDTSVIICPVCEARVKTVFGEKHQTTLKKHTDEAGEACKPAPRSKKPRCSVKGCREVLTFSNKFHCKNCRRDTCLKHRYAVDHLCAENKQLLFLESLAKRGLGDCGASSERASDGSSARRGNTSSSKELSPPLYAPEVY